MNSMKRALIIIASLIVLIGIIVGVYFLFFAGKDAKLLVGGNVFGEGSGTLGGEVIVTSEAANDAGTLVAPRLIRISEVPVSDGVYVGMNVESATTSLSTSTQLLPSVEVRYIERASGNVYSFLTGVRSLARIGNKTLPGIQKASWVPSGASVFVQYAQNDSGADSVATYLLPVGSLDSAGRFLEPNLKQAFVSGSSTLVTLLSGTTGSTATLSRLDGTFAKTLFSSSLSSLVVLSSRSEYFAHTKPSFALDGYAFKISAPGSFARILGPLRGLSILPSPSGSLVLYSYLDRGVLQLGFLDVATRVVNVLPVATLTDKCVWSQNSQSIYCGVPLKLSGKLPDDWHQGAVDFSDRIWEIDVVAREARLIVDPSEVAKLGLDITNLAVDTNNDMLVFSDRSTGSLWVYDL